MQKQTNPRRDIYGSKPTSPRRLSRVLIARPIRMTTTSGRRFTNTSASPLQLHRRRKRWLEARRLAAARHPLVPAGQNNSQDDDWFKELRRMTLIKNVRMD